jgi:hypothetical protein
MKYRHIRVSFRMRIFAYRINQTFFRRKFLNLKSSERPFCKFKTDRGMATTHGKLHESVMCGI